MSDPRWLSDPETPEALRAALEAGRAELPSDAELARMAAKLVSTSVPQPR